MFLSPDEKDSLTAFAKNIVTTGARSSGAKSSPATPPKGEDDFSVEGLSRRLTALERKVERIGAELKQNLDAAKFSIERFEARAAKSDGEVRALRELLDRVEFLSAAERSDLLADAREFAAKTASDLSQLIVRLNSILEGGLEAKNNSGSKGDRQRPE